MLVAVVFLVVVLAAGATTCFGLAMAETMYGYPVGRDLMQRRSRRRDEHRFVPGDVRDLDEAFRLVIRSHQAD